MSGITFATFGRSSSAVAPAPNGNPGGGAAPSQTATTPEQPEVRRSLHAVQERDILPLVGAAAAALALSYLVYYILLPWSGILGFVVLTYLLFLAVYALLVSMDSPATITKDRIASVVAHSAALLLLLALVVVVVFAFARGLPALRSLNFWISDLSVAGPLDPLSVGGVLHAIVGSLIMMAIALAVTIPLGITCAVFLTETRGPFTRFVRTIVEAMTALPSIIAGLFVYALILTGFAGKSGLAAGVALSVMMLPIAIRASDVVLRLVPGNLKEAAAALGAPRWRVAWHVILPTARSGLMTAVILATARGIGETSPVLLTAGYTTAVNLNPLQDNMVSLPLATFILTRSSEDTDVARGFGAASILMIIVLVLFALARTIGGRPAGDLSRAEVRRRARQSRADLSRFGPRAAESTPVSYEIPAGTTPPTQNGERYQ